jgi:hypothetical protein
LESKYFFKFNLRDIFFGENIKAEKSFKKRPKKIKKAKLKMPEKTPKRV